MKSTTLAFLTVASVISLQGEALAKNPNQPNRPNKPHQPHHQHKPVKKTVNNITNNNTTNNPTSNAQSNAQSLSNSSANNSLNLSQYTIHNTNNQYFEYSNGGKVPASQLNLNYINDDGRDVIQAGISIPLGVKKSSILKDVERSNKLEAARFCLDLVTSGATMDSERMQYFDCDGFIYPEVELMPLPVPVDNAQELADAKKSIQDALKELKEMKRMNEALQLRIIQMQHAPASGVLKG